MELGKKLYYMRLNHRIAPARGRLAWILRVLGRFAKLVAVIVFVIVFFAMLMAPRAEAEPDMDRKLRIVYCHDCVNVRIGPGLECRIKYQVPAGKMVLVIATFGDWCECLANETGNHYLGWIHGDYLK